MRHKSGRNIGFPEWKEPFGLSQGTDEGLIVITSPSASAKTWSMYLGAQTLKTMAQEFRAKKMQLRRDMGG